VPQNPAQAARLFRAAAERGNALAQFELGRAYAEGRGLQEDRRQAVHWLSAAASAGLSAAADYLRTLRP